ncbi:MAG: universal stress protein [Acidobacteria bacterium]|nr:universal stress protein [Acidobacteriota bacterium]MCI0622761.1 universal stress protein [Acidobacteriota bacterium]MCI0721961.1 universal stress protein [Acidobacteriota bacterium]
MRVLLVINENPISVDLVRGVLSLSDRESIHVRILLPVVLLRDRPSFGRLDLEWLTTRAECVAEKVADVFRARGLNTEAIVRLGDAAVNIIIEEAESWRADWIVLGQKLDEVVDGWLADTTVQCVTNYAPCSVKVVPLESWHGTI